jgi:hypothetical protein
VHYLLSIVLLRLKSRCRSPANSLRKLSTPKLVFAIVQFQQVSAGVRAATSSIRDPASIAHSKYGCHRTIAGHWVARDDCSFMAKPGPTQISIDRRSLRLC